MKLIVRLCFFLLLFGLALTALALLGSWATVHALLDDEPAVTQFESTSLEDLQRIKTMALNFSQQQDTSTNKRIELSQRDINLAIGHFAPMQVGLPPDSFAKVELDQQQTATVLASVPAAYVADTLWMQYQQDIPTLLRPLAGWLKRQTERRWLNARVRIGIDAEASEGQWLGAQSLGIGGLTLNRSLSENIVQTIYQQNINRQELALARESWQNLRKLEIADGQLAIEFMLPERGLASLSSYQALVLSSDEQALIAIYSQHLASLPQSGPLVRVLAAMFDYASVRSAQSADPVAENRGVLLALAKRYGGDQLLNMLQAQNANALSKSPKPYTLYGRRDLAQHLVLSAGLSLIANENLAELIGIDKEMSDLLGGQTISAWDLLADKAGVRLAQNATRSAKSARNVQLLLSKARKDRHVLPDLGAEFEFSEDRFSAQDLADLELMIELYLEQHKALQKQL